MCSLAERQQLLVAVWASRVPDSVAGCSFAGSTRPKQHDNRLTAEVGPQALAEQEPRLQVVPVVDTVVCLGAGIVGVERRAGRLGAFQAIGIVEVRFEEAAACEEAFFVEERRTEAVGILVAASCDEVGWMAVHCQDWRQVVEDLRLFLGSVFARAELPQAGP